MRATHLSILVVAFMVACTGDDAPDDSGTDSAPGLDGALADVRGADAPAADGAADDGGADATALDAARPDTGPLPDTVLFADDFDSYAMMDLTGRCSSPGDSGCDDASFPWESGAFEPGWTYLYTGGGGGGSYPYVAQITPVGARGGSGMNVQMWDENEHERGPSQWGHDFQLAKHWPEDQYEEIWLQMWVYWSSPTLVTSNQKMTHMFHYDPSEGSFFNTSESTDGGVICNWRDESGAMEFRCSMRCANPPGYKCSIDRNGVSFVSPEGSDWSGQTSRFELRTGDSCTVPDDESYETQFADGRWHKFEVGLRMNSAAGEADGEVELWFDDCRLGLLRGVPFRESGAESRVTGFNGVTFGGNAYPNDWGPDGTDAQTWQVDDVKICTERCP